MNETGTLDWRSFVTDKWLIFDADAIISIISFGAEPLLDELKKQRVSFNFIHPVLLELMNADNPKEKLKRSNILEKYGFVQLPIHDTEQKLASRIQKSWPLTVKTRPSSTDFYLGGVLAKYASSKTAYLLTSNVKDFPLPVYKREAFIPLQNDTNVKVISILSIDDSKLVSD